MSTFRTRYTATVTDNNDPEKRGRLKVACATLMGTDDNGEAVEYGDWVEPMFPFVATDKEGNLAGGFFAIPGVGAIVEIEISTESAFDESPGMTSINAPDPQWVACSLGNDETVPEEFQTNYPNRFGFRSSTGHTFTFDDSPGDDGKVTLASRPEEDGGPQSFLSMENDGSIQIITRNGEMIFLNAKTGEITFLDSKKNMISMKKDGITLATGSGHIIDMNDGGINVISNGNTTVQGSSVVVKGTRILLGDETAAVPVLLSTMSPSTVVFAKG